MTKNKNAVLIIVALVTVLLSCLFTVLMSVSGSSQMFWGILVLACLLVFATDMVLFDKRQNK